MKFRAVVIPSGNATAVEVPVETMGALGPEARPPVAITINGHTWRSRVALMRGQRLIGISAANRAAAGIAQGDTIEVAVELDRELILGSGRRLVLDDRLQSKPVTDPADIRPAVAGDAAEIGELYLASRKDALPFLARVHTDEQVQAWIADVLLVRCRVWVARRDQRLVGFVALDNDVLEQLYLRPGYYRLGIGSSLLEIAKAASPGRLRLLTFQRNERARAFYEVQGFRVVDMNDGSRNEEGEPDIQYEWTATI